jgi:hypothetical protein
MDLKRFSIADDKILKLLNSHVAQSSGSDRISGFSNNTEIGNFTGVNPFPYIGDPIPPLKPATVTIGTATTTSHPLATPAFPNALPNALPYNNVFQNWTPPLGALGDFFNVQYLSVEAVCAVTGRALKPGEPVLILDEHIISKAAFMKLLREGFERMMFRVEEMHEMTGYDS